MNTFYFKLFCYAPSHKGSLKIVLFVLCLSNQGSIAWIFFFLSLEEILLGLITWYLISSFSPKKTCKVGFWHLSFITR